MNSHREHPLYTLDHSLDTETLLVATQNLQLCTPGILYALEAVDDFSMR